LIQAEKAGRTRAAGLLHGADLAPWKRRRLRAGLLLVAAARSERSATALLAEGLRIRLAQKFWDAPRSGARGRPAIAAADEDCSSGKQENWGGATV
jgi:hypothetical protein